MIVDLGRERRIRAAVDELRQLAQRAAPDDPTAWLDARLQDAQRLDSQPLGCNTPLVKSADIIRALEADGWSEVRVKGSHHHFAHPTKPGIVTVVHPRKDTPIGTVKAIEKQAGITIR